MLLLVTLGGFWAVLSVGKVVNGPFGDVSFNVESSFSASCQRVLFVLTGRWEGQGAWS